MDYTVKAVVNPHDASDVKYHVMSEPVSVAVYDTEDEARNHGAFHGASTAKAKKPAKTKKPARKHK